MQLPGPGRAYGWLPSPRRRTLGRDYLLVVPLAAISAAEPAGTGAGAADVVAGACTVGGETCAVVPVAAFSSGSSGTISSATMLMILISGLTAGPAVSLYGSPTVSPVTAALCASRALAAVVAVLDVLLGVVPGAAAGAHRDRDEQAGDDRAHQQAAERRRAEQQADQDRHDHRQQRRDHHFLDRRRGQHVDRLAVLGLAGAFHDALDVAELAAHFHHHRAGGAARPPPSPSRRTGRGSGRR